MSTMVGLPASPAPTTPRSPAKSHREFRSLPSEVLPPVTPSKDGAVTTPLNSRRSPIEEQSHPAFTASSSPPLPAIPEPYLPLRKTTSTQLRLRTADVEPVVRQINSADGGSYSRPFHREERSRTVSPPRLLRDRQTAPIAAEPLLEADELLSTPSSVDSSSPSSLGVTRSRGNTNSSPISSSRSLPSPKNTGTMADLASFRRNLASTYRPHRGTTTPRSVSSPVRKELPSAGWPLEDDRPPHRSGATHTSYVIDYESRSSYKSSVTNGSHLTYASSNYVDYSGTERSSVLTRASSVSDDALRDNQPSIIDDDDFSVDDAIAMYANGFHDDSDDAERRPGKLSDVTSPAAKRKAQIIQSRGAEPLTIPTPRYDPFVSVASSTSPSLPELSPSPTDPASDRLSSPQPLSPDSPMESTPLESMLGPLSTPELKGNSRSSLPALPADAQLRQTNFSPRDRYGFKKTSQYVTLDQYDTWNREYTDYLDKRREKWVKIMQHQQIPTDSVLRFPDRSDKVKRYVRKGIPPEWRGAAWWWYGGGPQYLVEFPGLYKNVRQRCEDGALGEMDHTDIERDIHRTFPDNIRFKPDADDRNENLPGRDVKLTAMASNGEPSILRSLRRVLQAFAVHNPSIGYCQSLNYLAGLLLLFLNEDEEKAFILLNIITNKHLPGVHSRLLESNVDTAVLLACVKNSMPAIWSKVNDKFYVASPTAGSVMDRLPSVSLALTPWFMSLFVNNMPTETMLRVWDCLFYEGSKTIFRIGLAVFKVGEAEIRAVNDQSEIEQVVQSIPRKILDVNALMESCYTRKNGFGHLGQETIDRQRNEVRALVKRDRAVANGTIPADEIEPMEKRGREERTLGALRRSVSLARMRRNSSKKRPATAHENM